MSGTDCTTAMQVDGTMVVYNGDGSPLWSSKSYTRDYIGTFRFTIQGDGLAVDITESMDKFFGLAIVRACNLLETVVRHLTVYRLCTGTCHINIVIASRKKCLHLV